MFEMLSETVGQWVDDLRALDRDVSDAERIDAVRALEELKAAAAAAQARLTADFDASQRAAQAASRVRAAEQGRGIAAQVALARRESPARGARHLGLAKALAGEMPHTLEALTAGRLNEWRATLLVRETAHLSREHRGLIDAALVADPRVLDGLGDRALVAEAKKLAYRLDPQAALRRVRRAEADRRVTCRPAPDTMAHLTALLPVAQAVAAYAALAKAADTGRAAGDRRSRGQIMADTLVRRLTGQASAGGVPVEVQLVVTDQTLLGDGDAPAHLHGHGPLPAGLARDLVAEAAVAWLRRLYTAPGSGRLVAMESQRRVFPAGLRRFLLTRDQHCRTPWCDAPIRHLDHPLAHRDGGPTSELNGQGLCERCNYAKEAAGWRHRPQARAPGRHSVLLTTPTGHSYRSTAPPPAGTPPHPRPPAASRADLHFAQIRLAG